MIGNAGPIIDSTSTPVTESEIAKPEGLKTRHFFAFPPHVIHSTAER